MRRIALLCAVLLAAAAPASAHRGRSSLSVVEIDAATGAITVVHRLAAHDVEPALVDIAPGAQPSVDDADALAAFVAHVAAEFTLADEAGPITLTHTATELAGDDVRLTFTGRAAPPVAALTVDSGLLEGSHDDQENQVNVRRGKITRTVLLRAGDGPQRVTFDAAP
jgi:hypothetical protein